MNTDSVLHSLMGMAHFYASLIFGGILFQQGVYPHCYMDPLSAKGLVEALPIYALNVLAFGALVYTATRPFALLLEQLIHRTLSALDKSISK